MPGKSISPLQGQILTLIAELHYPSQIARILKKSRQVISYNIKQLESMGKIEERLPSSYPKNYILTSPASEILTSSRGVTGHVKKMSKPPDEMLGKYKGLRHIWFKVTVRKEGAIWSPVEVQLNNWIQKMGWLGVVHYRDNGSTFEFEWTEDDCEDPWEAEAKAYRRLTAILNFMEEKFGYDLGHPVRNRKWKHTTVGDKFTQEYVKHYGRIVVKGKGEMDNSPDEGTLHHEKTKTAAKYFDIPYILEEIRDYQAETREMTAFLAKEKMNEKKSPKEPDESSGMYG